MTYKILITGGCGFIGSNLAIFLKKKKFEINTLDNLSRKGSKLNLKRLKKFNIKNFKLNINNKKKLLKLPKYDFIIDCSALVEVSTKLNNIDKVLKTNFLGTNNILLKCVKDKSNIIFFSTSRVYSIFKMNSLIDNKKVINKKIMNKKKMQVNEEFSKSSPISFYGLSKKSSEQLIKEYFNCFKIKYLINRFGVIAGPWQFGKVEQGFFSLWIWRHLNKQRINFIGYGGNGYQVRDILHVDDLCEIVHRQVKKFNSVNNHTFNIGGSLKNSIDLRDLTYISRKITKETVEIKKIKKTDKSDIPIFVSNNKKIKKFYNWEPKKNILEIAKDILNWQKNNFKILKKYFN